MNERLITGRPGWAKIWFSIAFKMAERSTCPRRSTGAVIVTMDHQILTTGYNGAPSGSEHCIDVGCLMIAGHCLRTVHAEMNAVLQAARIGTSVEKSMLYATDRPCVRCIPLLLRSGIYSIMYARPYDTDDQRELVERMCRQAGVRLEHMPGYEPASTGSVQVERDVV